MIEYSNTISNPESFKYTFEELNITSLMLFNLMGYTNPDSFPAPLLDSIEELMKKTPELFNIRGGYCISHDFIVEYEKKRIFSHGEWFETKQIVTHQLRRSEKAAWFICTAGEEISHYSRKLTENGDPVNGYVVDVIANVALEQAMKMIQNTLIQQMAGLGLKTTNRYSPGYCEWNITEQKKLFKAFPENYLNISLTESSLMIPVKSVSGVIGIGKDVKFNAYSCNLCGDLNCIYRNKR